MSFQPAENFTLVTKRQYVYGRAKLAAATRNTKKNSAIPNELAGMANLPYPCRIFG